MLTKLELQRYRCFEQFNVDLRANTVLVGANNAGKSTVVEALRLVSIVVSRYRNSNWTPRPDWLMGQLAQSVRGIKPSLEHVSFDAKTAIYRYLEPPAIIAAHFSTAEIVTIYVGPPTERSPPEAQLFATIRGADGRFIRNKHDAASVAIPTIAVLAQPGPLLKHERQLNNDYVKRKADTDITSLHFRNQIRLHPDAYDRFKSLVEQTWPGLHVTEFTTGNPIEDEPLTLMIRDVDFVAEAGLMGSGVQMWLQTMWFLARNHDAAMVVLDEPDVYMHPDLQRRLFRFVKQEYHQVVVATHSVEIMTEAKSSEVLVVNHRSKRPKYADADPAVQRAIETVGGIHNLQLARLFSARRVLLVEGKDVSLLRPLYDLVVRAGDAPIDDIPRMSVGGWSGWQMAVGSGLFLRNAVGEDIVAYAIFDSDYHLPAEIDERHTDANNRGVRLHIWQQKEIENYLIRPSVIQRVLKLRAKEPSKIPSVDEVHSELDRLLLQSKDHILEQFAESVRRVNKSWDLPNCMREARRVVGHQLATTSGILARSPGKSIISQLSDWSRRRCDVSFGSQALAEEMQESELCPEFKQVLKAIARMEPFERPRGWWE